MPPPPNPPKKEGPFLPGLKARGILGRFGDKAPPWLRDIPMIQILRKVWVQQYYASDDSRAIFRTDEDVAPCAVQIHSPYDAEARFSTKRDILWAGYKRDIAPSRCLRASRPFQNGDHCWAS